MTRRINVSMSGFAKAVSRSSGASHPGLRRADRWRELGLILAVIAVMLGMASAPAAVSAGDGAQPNGVVRQVGSVWSVPDSARIELADGTMVRIGPLAKLRGFDGARKLEQADLVEVEGTWVGSELEASGIRMLRRAAGPASRYDEAPGEASNETAGDSEAAQLKLLTGQSREFVAFEGEVAEIDLDEDQIVLTSSTVVAVGVHTVFESFGSLSELGVGDTLWIEAYTRPGSDVLDALSLRRVAPSAPLIAFEGTVNLVYREPSELFTTSEGYVVYVTPATLFIGVTGISDLQRGDVVWVEGLAMAGLQSINATRIELLHSPGSGGAGLVDHLVGQVDLLLPPSTFVINATWSVVTSAATDWQGTLSGYNDLRPGMTVEAEVRWDRYGDLSALSVESVGVGEDAVSLSGTVIDAVPEIQRFRLATGELIIIRRGTPLDGDVHRITEIEEGMKLSAECVVTEGGEYQALWALVESQQASPFAITDYATSEALVVLVSGAHADQVASRHGATIVGTLPGSLISLFRWETPIGEQHVQMLRADPDVDEVEPNYRAQDPETVRRRLIAIDRTPTSDRFSRQYVVDQSGVTAAHERSTGAGTLVAVIDTGVDRFHPLLRHSIADGGWDFVDGDAEPWETADGIDQDGDGDVDEASGHGTFVAGLVLLVAPSTKILPYRVLNDDGHGTTFAISQAVLAAMDRGADVINMSFAYDEKPRVLDRILDEASRRGIVLVSGAGNSAATYLPFPARDHRVLAVAAVDETGALADFSNRGPDAAIAAAGVDLYSGGFEGEFGTWSGTSMAAPLVSGTALLLRSINPYLRPSQIEAALEQAAAPISGSSIGLLRIDAALDLVPTLWPPHQASDAKLWLAPTEALLEMPNPSE